MLTNSLHISRNREVNNCCDLFRIGMNTIGGDKVSHAGRGLLEVQIDTWAGAALDQLSSTDQRLTASAWYDL